MKRGLRILLWASGLFTLSVGMFGPIYAIFVEEIGGDLLTAGGAYFAYSIAAGILIYLLGRWEDHVKHQEKLVFAGFGIATLGTFGYLLISTPIHLFIVQIILGVSEAIRAPAYDSMYSRFLDKGKYASEWGMWESMYYIVTAVAALVGGLIANSYGFRVLFSFMFFIALMGFIASGILFKVNSKGE